MKKIAVVGAGLGGALERKSAASPTVYLVLLLRFDLAHCTLGERGDR